VFLVGVLSIVNNQKPDLSKAIPFAKVGTGYTFNELEILR